MRKSLALWMLMACVFGLDSRASAEEAVAPPAQQNGPPIVFVMPHDVETSVEASLRDALEAQFSGMQAALVFRRFESDLPDLRSQARVARELAQALGAKAVFWVEGTAGQEILLYLAEPDAERILVRRLQMTATSPAASAETVSIITRESTAALLAGHTIGMQPVKMEPVAQPSPPRPAPSVAPRVPPTRPTARRPRTPAHSPVAVEFGYQGNSYAPQSPWQHGLRFGARWVSAPGFYAGASYVLYQSIEITTAALALEVARHPIGIAAGWRFSESPIALLTEVGYAADFVSRRVVDEQQNVAKTPNEVRLASIIAPRVGLEYDLTEHLNAFAVAGIDVAVNNFEFITQVGTETRPLLTPYRLRASAGLGVGFKP